MRSTARSVAECSDSASSRSALSNGLRCGAHGHDTGHRASLHALCQVGALLVACGLGVAGAADLGGWPPDALPNAVVVHGRRGPNSNINGVYTRDYSWQGQIGPCYRRYGVISRQQNVFLYYEGEWRISPSPDAGSVWAFAASRAVSPLLIDTPWEVWDGQRVAQDPALQISDTSVIPSMLFLSFSEEGPPALKALQGMLLQQPGLWEGRPYYQHQAWHELFLLCSAAEGRWRLGPLPLDNAPSDVACTSDPELCVHAAAASQGAVLYSLSAAALPQEIIEPWRLKMGANDQSDFALGVGVLRLSTTTSYRELEHPRHLVVEGVAAGRGIANGIYRIADKQLNYRPVYHKTDALRPASLWYAGDWRLGTSIEEGFIWAYAPSTALSPLDVTTPWQRLDDGQNESLARVADATQVIPTHVLVAGDRYVQQPRLCDARPVYQREDAAGSTYLFFRAHVNEWWLGPTIGGSVFYARAAGSRLQVVPDTNELLFIKAKLPADTTVLGDQSDLRAAAAGRGDGSWWWYALVLTLTLAAGAARWLVQQGSSCNSNGRPAATDSNSQHSAGVGAGALITQVVAAAPMSAASSTRDDSGQYSVSGGADASSARMVPAAPLVTDACEELSPAIGYQPPVSPLANPPRTPTKPKMRKHKAYSCVVCCEAPREILLIPCRHVCCCKACADRLEKCPMCRAQKEDFAKVFL
mmetsp:Transcript_126845/g.224775  ORF Transcript_126845/g.224775 Transcript_126845/m.224775 type:complete len:699 (+) Transcript_126845:85-2181(+)